MFPSNPFQKLWLVVINKISLDFYITFLFQAIQDVVQNCLGELWYSQEPEVIQPRLTYNLRGGKQSFKNQESRKLFVKINFTGLTVSIFSSYMHVHLTGSVFCQAKTVSKYQFLS